MTDIRPELSKENKYYISKHRYYELKHFCLQYNGWKQLYNASLDLLKKQYLSYLSSNRRINDSTSKYALIRVYCYERMRMVEKAAEKTDLELSSYLLNGITNGVTYDYLKSRLEIPCCRSVYYQKYREFFWILNNIRK